MPCMMEWIFKSGATRGLVHEDYATCESLIHEWVMFHRGKDVSRLLSRDPMLGGKGWAFDMREIAAMRILDALPQPPPKPTPPPEPPISKTTKPKSGRKKARK